MVVIIASRSNCDDRGDLCRPNYKKKKNRLIIFQRKQEMFEVLKSMYGDRAIMPEEILVPDWHT